VTGTRTGAVKPTMAEVVAQRRTEMSPGRRFFEAVATDGLAAAVDFDVTITDSLTSSRRKPRHPVRNMLKVVDLSREPRQAYWHESPPRPGDAAVAGAETRRELASRFHRSPVPELLPTIAWVQVPDGLWEDPETFESFVNYRLIVRLSTAENVTILCGEAGLLAYPGIGTITSAGPFASPLLAACNEVEQMGGTADGLVLNPVDYYRFLGEGRLMDVLADNGVFIVRTRLVEPGTALVGDFGHGAQLFDSGRSTIRFADPPPGTFAEPGIAVMARISERAVVNLPTNFFLVSL
jgi:hypothetical protein